MAPNVAPFVGVAALTITSGLTIYFWRRSAGLYALLIEGANRFEELRQRSGAIEAALARAEEKAKLQREAQTAAATELAAAHAATTAAEERFQGKCQELKFVTEKLELQKGHLERQLAKFEGQVHVSRAEAEQLRANLATTAADLTRARSESERERLASAEELRLRELEAKRHRAEIEQIKAYATKEAERVLANRAKSETADLGDEVKRLRRKVAQYDRLYASMKGLREMSEERNRNWEIALRKLSAWIITHSGPGAGRAPVVVPAALGPLVAKALQVAGAQLIDDHELMAPAGPDEGAMQLARDEGDSDGEPAPLLATADSAKGPTAGTP